MKARQNTEKLNHLSPGALGMAVRSLITACLFSVPFRGAFAAYHLGYDIFYQQSVEVVLGRDIDVRIPEGQGTEEAAKQLKKLGFIRDIWAFRVQLLFLGRKMRVGEYCLNTSETIDEILELLSTTSEKRRSGKS